MVENNKVNEENVLALHQRSIIIDMMNVSMVPDKALAEAYIEKIEVSGVTAINMCVAINDNFRQAIEKISKWYRFIDTFSSKLMLARTTHDILDAKKEKKVAILLSFQNTTPIENDLNLLYIFKQLGVNMMQITYNERSLAGDGCSERTGCGLSDFGVDMIREMNRLGIAIDLSHVGKATTEDVLKITKKPVFYTHAGAFQLLPNPRNKTDDELRAVIGTGGMVGVLSLGTFLSKKSQLDITIDDFLDHLQHIVNVVGVDRVGFGLDLTENSKAGDYPAHKASVSSGWPWYYAIGLQSISDIPNITRGLLGRGYRESEIEGILGGNFLRVFEKATGQE
jgi:membrane dipeptidase